MRLIVSSMAYGSGHTMAAMALAEAFSAISPDSEVIQFDTILNSSCPLERFPPSFYIFTNKHAHWLWRALYYWPPFRSRLSESMMDALFCSSNIPKLKALLPDAVVSTHICVTRASVRLGAPTFAVVTDYVYHPFLFSDKACAYFVASEEIRDAIVARGFSRERIHLTGIPIRKMFWEPPPCPDSRAKLGLPMDEKIVLLMSGNQGVTPVGRIARVLQGSGAFLLVVTGKNERMRRRMEKLFQRQGINGKVFGVFLDMAELLCACDIIVTKGGGIISSECLASGLPMVFYDSIPGQEEGNARIISDWGAGVRARSAREAAELVVEIISDQTRLDRMKSVAREHGRPRAALDIAERVLGYLQKS
ncbi:MAG: MGDG synthase family glycosyltransferase [candidate division WOR-3 bacterium]